MYIRTYMKATMPVSRVLARLAAGAMLVVGCTAPLPDDVTDGQPVIVSASPAGAYEASLAVLDDGFAVGWYDTRDGQGEIYLRLLDADGRPASDEQRATTTEAESYEVDLAPAGEWLGVAWYEKAGDDAYSSWLALREPAGAESWRVRLSSAGRNPVVEWDGEAFFCAWLEDGETDASTVWVGWWRPDGSVLLEPRPLAAAGRTTWNLNAAATAPGDVWLAFDAQAGTESEELFAVRVAAETDELRQLTPDDGVPSKYPDVAMAGGVLALTWHDERDGNQEVYLTVGEDPTPELVATARRVTETPGASIGAYLAWNGPRLGLAWSDDTAGQHEVFFQDFDAAGVPRAAARRLTDNPTSSLIPSIRAWRNGFALAWNEYQPAPEGAHADTARSQIAVAVLE